MRTDQPTFIESRFADLLVRFFGRLPPWMKRLIGRVVERNMSNAPRRLQRLRQKRALRLKKQARPKGSFQKCIEELLHKAGDFPPIKRTRRHVAASTCALLNKWALKAQAAGYNLEADLFSRIRRTIDGSSQAYNQATLRILTRPRPPRRYPDIDPEKLLWSEKFLELCLRGMLAELPKEPGPNRKIIRWFVWDADFSAPSVNFMSLIQRINLVIIPRGWQFLVFQNYGNFDFGSLKKSVTRRDFFQFQQQFNAILDTVDLKLSGALWHTWSSPDAEFDRNEPHEQYMRDRLTFGDGNGRPRRHEIKIMPVLPAKEGGVSA